MDLEPGSDLTGRFKLGSLSDLVTDPFRIRKYLLKFYNIFREFFKVRIWIWILIETDLLYLLAVLWIRTDFVRIRIRILVLLFIRIRIRTGSE